MSELTQRIAALTPERREILLRRLRAQAQDQPATPAPPAIAGPLVPDPAARHEPFPLTEVQEVYLAGRSACFELGGCGANVYMELAIDDPAGDALDRFEAALARLIARHDMLRAVVMDDGRQRVLARVPAYRIPVVDLRGVGEAPAAAQLTAARLHLQHKVGAADRWPLFDFLAQRLGGGRLYLHVRFDALLLDGLSREILMRDLLFFLADPAAALPPLPLRYRDYAVARAALRETEPYARARAFWQQRLPSLPPPPSLPLAAEGGGAARLASHNFRLLTPAAWARLRQRAASHRLTPSALVLFAFAEVIAAWNHQRPFSLGLVGAQSEPAHPRRGEVVGNYNTIHIVSYEALQGTWLERAAALQAQLMTILEHGVYSGFEVLRALRRRHRQGGRALMPVLFNSVVEYTHSGHAELDSVPQVDPGLAIEQLELELIAPQIALMPTVSEGGDGALFCRWQAAQHLFAPEVTRAMAEAYRTVLDALAAIDGRPWEAQDASLVTEVDLEGIGAGGAAGGWRPWPADGAVTSATVEQRDGELEARLVRIWCQVLALPTVAASDDFFALGGDSLRAVLMFRRIEEELGRTPPYRSFFADPTIRHLSALLRAPNGEHRSPERGERA